MLGLRGLRVVLAAGLGGLPLSGCSRAGVGSIGQDEGEPASIARYPHLPDFGYTFRSCSGLSLAHLTASRFLRATLFRSAHTSHLVWFGMAGFGQSLHSPAALRCSRLFFLLCRWTSWRPDGCRRRRSYSWRLVCGPGWCCSVCVGKWSEGACAVGSLVGFSSDRLAAARCLLSSSLRRTLCCSAHRWQRVCPSIAGSRQCLQRPRALNSSSCLLKRARSLSFLASGVSGNGFVLSSFGALGFLLVFALAARFCSFFFTPRLG